MKYKKFIKNAENFQKYYSKIQEELIKFQKKTEGYRQKLLSALNLLSMLQLDQSKPESIQLLYAEFLNLASKIIERHKEYSVTNLLEDLLYLSGESPQCHTLFPHNLQRIHAYHISIIQSISSLSSNELDCNDYYNYLASPSIEHSEKLKLIYFLIDQRLDPSWEKLKNWLLAIPRSLAAQFIETSAFKSFIQDNKSSWNLFSSYPPAALLAEICFKDTSELINQQIEVKEKTLQVFDKDWISIEPQRTLILNSPQQDNDSKSVENKKAHL